MDSKLNGLMEAIRVYTGQIERYETLSTWFAAFHVVCLLVLLSFAGFLLLRRRGESGGERALTTGILSASLLGVPVLTTLYLYTFAMNMRKVALYRGYLSFLEQCWNQQSGLNAMLFDGEIITEFFSFQRFLVNGLGPVVMSVFILLALGLGFGLSIYFQCQLPGSRMKRGLAWLTGVTLVVSLFFDVLCTYYLSTNDAAVQAVLQSCQNLIG